MNLLACFGRSRPASSSRAGRGVRASALNSDERSENHENQSLQDAPATELQQEGDTCSSPFRSSNIAPVTEEPDRAQMELNQEDVNAGLFVLRAFNSSAKSITHSPHEMTASNPMANDHLEGHLLPAGLDLNALQQMLDSAAYGSAPTNIMSSVPNHIHNLYMSTKRQLNTQPCYLVDTGGGAAGLATGPGGLHMASADATGPTAAVAAATATQHQHPHSRDYDGISGTGGTGSDTRVLTCEQLVRLCAPEELIWDLAGLSLIGLGRRSVACQALWRGARVAVKFTANASIDPHSSAIIRQALVSKALAHPNVLQHYSVRCCRLAPPSPPSSPPQSLAAAAELYDRETRKPSPEEEMSGVEVGPGGQSCQGRGTERKFAAGDGGGATVAAGAMPTAASAPCSCAKNAEDASAAKAVAGLHHLSGPATTGDSGKVLKEGVEEAVPGKEAAAVIAGTSTITVVVGGDDDGDAVRGRDNRRSRAVQVNDLEGAATSPVASGASSHRAAGSFPPLLHAVSEREPVNPDGGAARVLKPPWLSQARQPQQTLEPTAGEALRKTVDTATAAEAKYDLTSSAFAAASSSTPAPAAAASAASCGAPPSRDRGGTAGAGAASADGPGGGGGGGSLSFNSYEGFGDPFGSLRHALSLPHVTALLSASEGEYVTAIIMEHADKATLHRAVQRGLFIPNRVWSSRVALRALLRTSLELAFALQHLHSRGVVHGSLRPANVLLKSSNIDRRGFTVKVTNFSLARVCLGDYEDMVLSPAPPGVPRVDPEDVATSPAPPTGQAMAEAGAATGREGAPTEAAMEAAAAGVTNGRRSKNGGAGGLDAAALPFWSPEQLCGVVGKPSDVYAFGVTLYYMATASLPYTDIPVRDVVRGVSSGVLTPEWPSDGSGGASGTTSAIAAASTASSSSAAAASVAGTSAADPTSPPLPPAPIRALCASCWQADPRARPTFSQICTSLQAIEHAVRQQLRQGTSDGTSDSGPQAAKAAEAVAAAGAGTAATASAAAATTVVRAAARCNVIMGTLD